MVRAMHPDVALLDLKLSAGSDFEGLTLCGKLSAAHPGIGLAGVDHLPRRQTCWCARCRPALARAGRLGRLTTIAVTTGALAGRARDHTRVRGPVRSGRGGSRRRQFLLDNTSYYAATAWVNEHISADARVAVDHVFVYPFEPEAIVWSADVLESNAGEAETRAFVRRFGITHAVVFADNRVATASWTRSGRA